MKKLEFDIINLDVTLGSLRGAAPGRSIELAGEVGTAASLFVLQRMCPPAAPGMLFPSAINSELFATWEAVRSRTVEWPIGVLHFKNVYLYGPNGGILDLEARKVFIGNCIGWGIDYLKWNAGNLLKATVDEHNQRLEANVDEENVESFDDMVLYSGPGFDIYGHQLLDYLPKARLIQSSSILCGMPVYQQQPKQWAAELQAMIRFDPARITGKESQLTFHKNLYVPTYSRVWAVADEHYLSGVVADLKYAAARTAAVPPENTGNLFISRAKWAPNKRSDSTEHLEAQCLDLGISVIHPETASLVEQIRLFQGSRFVMGEDGSALHSIVFADQPPKLMVIDTGRKNLLHMAVAAAVRASVGYIDAADAAKEPLKSTVESWL
jgi:hypothetical protein